MQVIVSARASGGVSDSLRWEQHARSDQTALWDDVDELLADLSVASATRSMGDSFDSGKSRIDAIIASLSIPGDATGCAVALFKALYPKLIRSWAIESLRTRGDSAFTGNVGERQVRAFLDAVADAPARDEDTVGPGQQIRFGSPAVFGAALVHEGNLVHLAAFVRSPSRSGANAPFRTGNRLRRTSPRG